MRQAARLASYLNLRHSVSQKITRCLRSIHRIDWPGIFTCIFGGTALAGNDKYVIFHKKWDDSVIIGPCFCVGPQRDSDIFL